MTMSPTISRRIYVQRILALYRLAPGTLRHLRRSDRRLAAELQQPDRGWQPAQLVRAHRGQAGA